MVQTDLKSDNFCGYNTSAAPYFWVADPVQTRVQFNSGETGVFTGVGLHTPPQVVDVSSMIVGGGRDQYLTSCVPPKPAISMMGNSSDDSIRGTGLPLNTQGFNNTITKDQINSMTMKNMEEFENNLNNNNLPNYSDEISIADGQVIKNNTNTEQFLQGENTKKLRSASDYSSVDWQAGFSGNAGNLYTDPQNLTYVIERMALERGGLDQNQMIKQSQEPWAKNTYLDFKKNGHQTGPKALNGKEQMPTCQKIRQPYNTKYPFGIPVNEREAESYHFNAIDVASQGKSSPVLDQNTNSAFNYEAIYSNGGCNKVSLLDCKNMDRNNDLTGVASFASFVDFTNDMPPPGLFPLNEVPEVYNPIPVTH